MKNLQKVKYVRFVLENTDYVIFNKKDIKYMQFENVYDSFAYLNDDSNNMFITNKVVTNLKVIVKASGNTKYYQFGIKDEAVWKFDRLHNTHNNF